MSMWWTDRSGLCAECTTFGDAVCNLLKVKAMMRAVFKK